MRAAMRRMSRTALRIAVAMLPKFTLVMQQSAPRRFKLSLMGSGQIHERRRFKASDVLNSETQAARAAAVGPRLRCIHRASVSSARALARAPGWGLRKSTDVLKLHHKPFSTHAIGNHCVHERVQCTILCDMAREPQHHAAVAADHTHRAAQRREALAHTLDRLGLERRRGGAQTLQHHGWVCQKRGTAGGRFECTAQNAIGGSAGPAAATAFPVASTARPIALSPLPLGSPAGPFGRLPPPGFVRNSAVPRRQPDRFTFAEASGETRRADSDT